MTTINPWINFNGNAQEAFDFYKTVFGGEFTKVTRFKDIASAEFPVAEKDADKIMRITLQISNGGSLTGNDVPEFMGTVNENESRSKIYVNADTKEEGEKIFSELSNGGQVEVPYTDDGQGTCFSMFRDRYGIEWVVEFNPNN